MAQNAESKLSELITDTATKILIGLASKRDKTELLSFIPADAIYIWGIQDVFEKLLGLQDTEFLSQAIKQFLVQPIGVTGIQMLIDMLFGYNKVPFQAKFLENLATFAVSGTLQYIIFPDKIVV